MKIEWIAGLSDMDTIIGIGGQITVDGKKYRHAVELNITEELQKAKYEIELRLEEMIKRGS